MAVALAGDPDRAVRIMQVARVHGRTVRRALRAAHDRAVVLYTAHDDAGYRVYQRWTAALQSVVDARWGYA